MKGFPKTDREVVPNIRSLERDSVHTCFCFHFLTDPRQENQKLKELVTGGASAAGSAVVPSDTEAAEAKEEPVKEESAAVRLKMEASTPQKVVQTELHRNLLAFVS